MEELRFTLNPSILLIAVMLLVGAVGILAYFVVELIRAQRNRNRVLYAIYWLEDLKDSLRGSSWKLNKDGSYSTTIVGRQNFQLSYKKISTVADRLTCKLGSNTTYEFIFELEGVLANVYVDGKQVNVSDEQKEELMVIGRIVRGKISYKQ